QLIAKENVELKQKKMELEKIKKFVNGLIEFSQEKEPNEESGNHEVKLYDLIYNPGPQFLIDFEKINFTIMTIENNFEKKPVKSNVIKLKNNGTVEFNLLNVQSYLKTIE
ncbi:TPA: hypothetical protein ACT5CK_002374, partial [Flavobacterium psychrophilum]